MPQLITAFLSSQFSYALMFETLGTFPAVRLYIQKDACKLGATKLMRNYYIIGKKRISVAS